MTSPWSTRGSIDPPWRIARLTAVRHRVGERRYREIRYSMDVARARLDITRLCREMALIRLELNARAS